MPSNKPQQFSPQVENLWKDASRMGMPRRRFLALLALGGSSAVIAGLAGMQNVRAQTPTPTGTPAPTGTPGATPTGEASGIWVKDTEPFRELGTNLETLPGSYNGWITANDHFFVRNHVPTPLINVEDYRLRVEGDAVQEPLELTYEQIRNMPSHTVASYLECAGNQRSLFDKVLGEMAEGGQWTYGAVGMASWTGVRLADILEMAGVSSNAVDVNLMGLDEGGAPEGGFNKPMSIEKAMNLDTILAYTMNGEDLPPDNGYPLRALVPGWVGSNSIKWLGTITVSSEPIYVRNNTSSYVLVGEQWPPSEYAPAEGKPVYENNIKSFIHFNKLLKIIHNYFHGCSSMERRWKV